jgi:hypothetical protein
MFKGRMKGRRDEVLTAGTALSRAKFSIGFFGTSAPV